jgi:hypothetical protein
VRRGRLLCHAWGIRVVGGACCAYTLFVDGLGLLWGQPELGGHRLWVYGRWCRSGARGGGRLRLPRFAFPLFLPFRFLCPPSVVLSLVLSIRCRFASPSLSFALPPIHFFLHEPLILLVNGLLADRGEFLQCDP